MIQFSQNYVTFTLNNPSFRVEGDGMNIEKIIYMEVGYMKRILALLFAVVLILSLCACNNGKLPDDDNNKQTPNSDNQQTPDGNIEFSSTFSRAGYGIPNIYNNALNASKLNGNSFDLPVYKFDTLEDLETFKRDFGGESGFNYGWDEVPSFDEATEYCDTVFFEKYTLMLVYVTASSGSYRFGFKDISFEGGSMCISVEQTNNPRVCTDDMAGWFITVAVPDAMISECTEFNAVLNTDNILPMPGTNLEFWIGENVDDFDFSAYQEKYGLFGGNEYYGAGYVPTIDENGEQVDPERCVIYTVTSYPDYSDKEQHITGIYITDPDISFYGVSLNSSFAEFEDMMQRQGFELTSSNENHRTASKGKYSITITKEWIRIRVEVENKYGIVF